MINVTNELCIPINIYFIFFLLYSNNMQWYSIHNAFTLKGPINWCTNLWWEYDWTGLTWRVFWLILFFFILFALNKHNGQKYNEIIFRSNYLSFDFLILKWNLNCSGSFDVESWNGINNCWQDNNNNNLNKSP